MSHEPLCPYCNHRFRDMYEYEMDDDDVRDTECPSCDKPVSIRCKILIEYDVIKRGDPGCKNIQGFKSHDCFSGEQGVFRDCNGDGHYMCGFCTRLEKSDAQTTI